MQPKMCSGLKQHERPRMHIPCNRRKATNAIISRQTLQDNETTIVQFVLCTISFYLCMPTTLCASEMRRRNRVAARSRSTVRQQRRISPIITFACVFMICYSTILRYHAFFAFYLQTAMRCEFVQIFLWSVCVVWCVALANICFHFPFCSRIKFFVFCRPPFACRLQSTVFYIFDRYYYYYCCYSSLWIVIPTKHSLWFCFS